MNVIGNNIPKLDIHGEDRIGAKIKVLQFIEDNYKLGKEYIAIIHGIGKGILKKEVHKVLKENKKVKDFSLDMFNSGSTTVKLAKKIDSKQDVCYNIQQNVRGNFDV